MQNVYALPDYDAKTVERIYSKYLEDKANLRGEVAWDVVQLIAKAGVDIENEEHFFELVLCLSAMSSYYKNVVQALLEAHYPDLNEEKTREELEKKEAAKRQKAEQKAEKKAAKAKKETADKTGEEGE